MNGNSLPPAETETKSPSCTNTIEGRPRQAGTTVFRVIKWTAIGTVVGFLVLSSSSFLGRYPFIGTVLNFLMLPAMGMLYLWQSLGLGPHGDAGFIMIPVCMVAEWAVAGFLFGIGRSVYLRNKGGRRSSEVTHKGRSRRPLLYALVIIALAVAGYLLQQEARIAMDRKYFLEKVNYNEFADACLEMVVNPDKYGLSLGNCKVDDPKLPEAIRKIKASTLSYHGYEVRISNFYFQGLAFSHNMKDATRYDVIFESNYREPVPLYSLHSTNLPKIDWH